jgi:hypothetical protein
MAWAGWGCFKGSVAKQRGQAGLSQDTSVHLKGQLEDARWAQGRGGQLWQRSPDVFSGCSICSGK